MAVGDLYNFSLLMFSVIWLLYAPLDAQQLQESCPAPDTDCCDCPLHIKVQAPIEDLIVRGAPGDSISVHCSRTCGQQFRDRWLIQLWNESCIVENNCQLKSFLKGVTLSMSNTNSNSCSDEIIQYSLHLENITMDINGLVINCGVEHLTNIKQEWYAQYSIQVFLENSSTVELNATLTQTQKDLNDTNQDLTTCNLIMGERIATAVVITILVYTVILIFVIILCCKYGKNPCAKAKAEVEPEKQQK